MSILTKDEINEIINAKTSDPFSLLGIHQLDEKRVVVRTFYPGLKEVYVKSDQLKADIRLEKIHEDGLFEKAIDKKEIFDYKFEYEDYDGNKWEVDDPYSFLPVTSEYDIHLFNEGNHHHIYEKMGAHLIEHEGVEGVSFAVWAPNAKRVSVIGDFNSWDGRVYPMRILGSSGIWEIFIPGLVEGEKYKFEILTKDDDLLLKSDPYAFYSEKRPATASVIYDLDDKYEWNDEEWLNKRSETNWHEEPMSIYEVSLTSWSRVPEEGDRFLTYREFADELVGYLKENNYTHVELMPVSEYPLDESWGYQVTGYFSATSRFGKPEDLMYLIDKFHQNDIGVILDWVPGHFPKDSHGLGKFDGSALYEHLDPRKGEHKEWGTYIFNYGRNEVKNFLISNAIFWLNKFHIDGLRVDAVASMLYLDYGKEDGEWVTNKYGGRENLEAIEFLKYFNSVTHEYFPGILTIAEESTSWEGVSKPTYLGGLGFSMKWNMGWMNDTLDYIKNDPIHRKYHHGELTFSLIYAFHENFILVLSHDEVVHGKKSMLDKMPGDFWQKFANLRLYYAYMYAHPGKNLLFMGGEFGQWKEWSATKSLDWHLLDYGPHKKLLDFNRELNGLYQQENAFWEIDFDSEGFEWIDCNDAENSTLSFVRKGKREDDIIVCLFNFTPVPRENYRVGLPEAGKYEEIFNTDQKKYYGSGFASNGVLESEEKEWQGRDNSVEVSIPPLGGIYLKYKG